MAGVAWVGGTIQVTGSGTSIAAAAPSGLQTGDCLIAWVIARSALTPPAGWTLLGSIAHVSGGGTTQTLYCYRKNSVTAGDSGATFTFTQASSLTYGICYQAARADSGVAVVRSLQTTNLNNTATVAITPPAVTVDRGLEIVLLAGATIVASTGSFSPTPPTGFTMTSGTNEANYRCMAAQRPAVEGLTTSGTFTLLSSGSGNGIAAIILRVTDQQEAATLPDGVSVDEAFDTGGSTYSDVTVESLGLHALLGTLHQDGLLDEAGIEDLTTSILPLLVALEQTFRAQSAAVAASAVSAVLVDEAGVADALSALTGVIVRDGLGAADRLTAAVTLQQALVDAVRTVDAARPGMPMLLSDAAGIAGALSASWAVLVAQEIGIARLLAPATRLGGSVTESAQLTAAALRFLGAGISDAVVVEQLDVAVQRALATMSDSVGLEDVPTPRLLLKVATADAVSVSMVEAVQMLLSGQIAEGVQVDGAYLAPDGSFTTWVMNTRTGAVGEYRNYAFNSFAKIGERYVGATADGLYELLGDDDDGAPIVTTMRGGFLQFGGTKLSRLKEAYIASIGDEDSFLLKIETLDGATYIYQADTRSGRSSRVNMGKGQRARYFAWELTSSGAQFDLDTIEFVPIVVQRRV